MAIYVSEDGHERLLCINPIIVMYLRIKELIELLYDMGVAVLPEHTLPLHETIETEKRKNGYFKESP